MAVIKAVSSRASIGRAVTYVTKTEKTEDRLVSGIGCSPETAIEEMKATKAQWGKEDGRQYMHFVHSFPPGENVTPQQAHQMARDLFQDRFKGHEILIATHTDKDHIHSHIIVNSVGYENGKKLQHSKGQYEQLKRECNEQCQQRGLSVPVKGQEITTYNQGKYKALERGLTDPNYDSYLVRCYKAVNNAKQTATSREDFIAKMKEQGWEARWVDTRKNVTFINQDGKKVRDENLEKTFKEPFSKEDLSRAFEVNAERSAARGRDAIEQAGERDEDRSPDLDKYQTRFEASMDVIRANDAARAERRGEVDRSVEVERDNEPKSAAVPARDNTDMLAMGAGGLINAAGALSQGKEESHKDDENWWMSTKSSRKKGQERDR